MSHSQTLEKLIADDKIDQVIGKLKDTEVSDSKLKESITLISAQFEENKRKEILGLALSTNPNQIRKSLLDIVHELDKVSSQSITSYQTRIENFYTFQKKIYDVKATDIMPIRARSERYRDDIYLEREYLDNFLLEKAKNGRSLIIVGNPLAGKTRAIWEILKKIREKDSDISVISPKIPKFSEADIDFILSPIGTKNCIAIIDDLQDFYKSDSVKANKMISALIKGNIQILATCRSGLDYEKYKRNADVDILDFFEDGTVEILKTTDEVVGHLKKLDANIKLYENEFDRNIGSLFIGLKAMRERYNNEILNKRQNDMQANMAYLILYATKCFYYGGNFEVRNQYEIQKIKGFCQRLIFEFGGNFDLWDSALSFLSSLNFTENSRLFIKIEETYIENIIEPIQVKDIVTNEIDYEAVNDIIREKVESLYKSSKDCRNDGFYDNIYWYNNKISRCRHFEKAYSLFEKLKKEGLKPDIYTYSSLISKCQNFNQINEILDEAQQKISFDLIAYNTLIDKCESYQRANFYFNEMKRNKVEPDVFTYNGLIKHCGNFKEANFLFQEMTRLGIRQDKVSYGNLMKYSKNFDKAISIFQQMHDKGVKPDSVTYGTLINLASLENAILLFEKMQKQGIKPDIITYGTLLNKSEMTIEQAETIFKQMSKQGIKADVRTYSYMIQRCGSDFNKALYYYNELCYYGMLPDVYTFSRLIKIADSFEKAKEIFSWMSKKRVEPDEIIYSCMIGKSDTFEQADEFVQAMLAKGIRPNERIHQGLLKKANKETAIILFRQIEKDGYTLNKELYTTIFHKGDFVLNKNLFEKMESNKILPDTTAINELMRNSANFEEAKDYYQRLSKYNLKPDFSTFKSLLDRAHNYNSLVYIIEKISRTELYIDKPYYDKAIEFSSNFEQADYIYSKLLQANKYPNSHTFNKMIKKADSYKNVIYVLKLMAKNKINPDSYTFNSMKRMIRGSEIEFEHDFYEIFKYYP